MKVTRELAGWEKMFGTHITGKALGAESIQNLSFSVGPSDKTTAPTDTLMAAL